MTARLHPRAVAANALQSSYAERDFGVFPRGRPVLNAACLPVQEKEPVLALWVLERILQQAPLIAGHDRNDSIASLPFRAAHPHEREIRTDIIAPSPRYGTPLGV